MMVQCIVHHELAGDNVPLTFRIPVTTLCQQFVDDIATLLSCSNERLSVYYDRHSLLDSVDKVCAQKFHGILLVNNLLDNLLQVTEEHQIYLS